MEEMGFVDIIEMMHQCVVDFWRGGGKFGTYVVVGESSAVDSVDDELCIRYHFLVFGVGLWMSTYALLLNVCMVQPPWRL